MRRPARLERAGAMTPRDRIWAAIRCFGPAAKGGREFSVAEIMALSGQRDDTLLVYLRGLEKAGYIQPRQGQQPAALRRRREFRQFLLMRDVGLDAPRVTGDGGEVTQGAGRDQMWRAMKALKDFDHRELAAAASTERHQVSPEEAQTYIRFLRLAGYLRVTRPATHGPGSKPERLRFLSARNTGPRAPLVTREKCVMDGNTGAIVYNPKDSGK